MSVRVVVIIRFHADAPEGEAEGDEWADEVGDAIAAAVETLPTIYKGSVSVVDWNEAVDE